MKNIDFDNWPERNGVFFPPTTSYLETMDDIFVNAITNNWALDDLNKALSGLSNVPEYAKNFYRAKYFSRTEQYEEATPYISQTLSEIENLSAAMPLDDELTREIYHVAGEIMANTGERAKSLELYEKYLNKTLQKEDSVPTDNLLSFRNINCFTLYDLINYEVTVCHPKKMNDPFDTLFIKWMENNERERKEKINIQIFAEAFGRFKIRSFCHPLDEEGNEEISNSLLWSHYAAGHTGLCIEYSFSNSFIESTDYRSSRFKKVSYKEEGEVIDLTTKTLSTRVGLWLKDTPWGYENEIRLITYTPKDTNDVSQIKLDPQSKIKSIYFGYRCDEKSIQTIKRILSSDPDIRYYKMKSYNKDDSHLYAEPI